MRKILLLLLAVTSNCFSLPYPEFPHKKEILLEVNQVIDEITALVNTELAYPKSTLNPSNELQDMLRKEAGTLNITVINKVLTTLKCAKKYNTEHNNILTIIDYSLPSSEKRLWVFDLAEKKLLFHTYVSHGIKSGALLSNYFSNKHDSKASSIGVYTTEQTYYGRDGLSLRLDGLERGFNDNASSRYVVMHGGWYVDENFIKKYGRAGRSWGCPALPPTLTQAIINTIKDKSLFVIYYPNDNWLLKSKFQTCDNPPSKQPIVKLEPEVKALLVENEPRESILFADLNRDNHREENEPIVVMTADNYQRVFHTKAPLERMLRRQINQVEYIALSDSEFKNLVTNNDKILNNPDGLNTVYFVIPVIKMIRGYYETQMQIVSIGKIKDVSLDTDSSKKIEQTKNYTVHYETKPSIGLRATNRFIRWVGL